jgi:hypothetical protein
LRIAPFQPKYKALLAALTQPPGRPHRKRVQALGVGNLGDRPCVQVVAGLDEASGDALVLVI